MKIQVKNLAKTSGKDYIEIIFVYPSRGTYCYVGMRKYEDFIKDFGYAYIYSMCDSLPDAITVFIGVYGYDFIRSEELECGGKIE